MRIIMSYMSTVCKKTTSKPTEYMHEIVQTFDKRLLTTNKNLVNFT